MFSLSYYRQNNSLLLFFYLNYYKGGIYKNKSYYLLSKFARSYIKLKKKLMSNQNPIENKNPEDEEDDDFPEYANE
jgi:hypothetical protein